MRSVFRRSRRRIAHLLGVALVAVNVTLLGTVPSSVSAETPPPPCATPVNKVACENTFTPPPDQPEWMVTAIDDSIVGFTDNISYAPNEQVRFKVKTDAPQFWFDIYRLGYYGGAGARKLVNNQFVSNGIAQPACFEDEPASAAQDTGIVDCGNWSTSMTWTVPSGAVSGVYYAVLRRDYGNNVFGESDIVFVVRDDASHSDILFQTADATWQAYNTYGNREQSPKGNSFYSGQAQGNGGSAYKVSYNRPIVGGEQENFFFNAEYPMLRWLEKNGYDVSYTTNVDMSRRGHLLKNHKVYMPVGHDEYWSNEQRAAVEEARDAGVNMAFMTGNEIFWKTRWEQSKAGPVTDWRTLVCYKETKPNQVDPHPTEWTGTWRDPRKSPPKDGGRPENALLGQIFTVNGMRDDQLTVPPAYRQMRLWRNTPPMGTLPNQAYVFKPGTLGYEWDTVEENGFQPPGVAQLSRTTVEMNAPTDKYVLLNEGDVYGPGTKTHALTLYRHQPSGALVFAAGTVQWSWGLDNKHIRNVEDAADPRIQQATANLLADMDDVQPRTPRDVTPATMSTDTTAPVVTFGTTPSPVVGSAYTFTGAVSDIGGRVSGVEVSVDNGASWHAANWQAGQSTWNYTYTPASSGSATFKVRAVDDSANLSGEVSRSVTVSARTCPCSIWPDNAVPATPDAGDATPLELGVKFQASSDGYIRGVRFYKGVGNTGTHTGSLWRTDGTLLATGTFLNETALGWQTLTFPESVPITANTTYVASYHTAAGHYAADANYFTNSSTGLEPLTALQGTAQSPNGVYKVGSSGFPDRSYLNANYWVDVVYGYDPGPDTRAPLVSSTSPVSNGGSVGLNVTPKISFDEPIAPASLQFSLSSPTGNIPGTYALAPDGKSATFTPSQPLASGTSFTATVRASDNAGNSIPSPPYTWSFTTGNPRPAACPCTIWDDFATPNEAAANDPSAVELGTKVRFDSRGIVHGIRFYKGPGNTGTHSGSLWTSNGTRLATGTFTNESGGGWQTLLFSSPVSVQSGTTYIVSYYAPNGRYAVTGGYFNGAGGDYGPMHALPSGVDGNNGVYRYGSGGGFPTNSYGNTNYWVDVIWQAGANGDSTPPTVTSTNPPANGSGVSLTAPVSVTLNEPVDLPTAQFTVKDSGGAKINGTLSLSQDQRTVSWTPTARLTAGATYHASFKIADVNGNIMPNATTWSFTTTLTQTCPCSLFSEATVPTVTAENDPGNYELGVRFTTSANGFVTGIKFYKGVGNTGTHTGTLWTNTGVPLATGTFTNETATGWQTLTFSTPAAVQQGQTYVASYTAPVGRYAADGGYFNRTAVTSNPLSAPLSGPGSANGVYKVGPGFPASTFQGGNYWVDVVFTP